MKKTEVAPGAESNDFRFGVNGFPKAGGLYRMGDNGAIPPHRFYRAWNIQFNGDQVTERGGQTEFCDTDETIPVTGIFSSNEGWPDEPGISGSDSEVPRLQWGEMVRVTGPVGTDGYKDKTGYKADTGMFTVTGFDPTYAGWSSSQFFAEDTIGGRAGYSNGTLVNGVWNDDPPTEQHILQSTCKHDGKFFMSMFGHGPTLLVPNIRILYTTPKTTNAAVYSGDPNHADYTDITDTGVTILDYSTAAVAATEVNCAPFLFSFQGSLYAMYRRLRGTPRGLIRKWSGTGTTWSTFGTFPTLPVKDDGTENYASWDMGGSERGYAYWQGALYFPIVQTPGDNTAIGYNDIDCNALSILKFDGATLTVFYTYSVPALKRSTGAGAGTTTGARRVPGFHGSFWNKVVNGYYWGATAYIFPFISQGRLFIPFCGQWAGTPGMNWLENYPNHCLIFNPDGTLYGDTITTPNLIYVQGSVKPTLPVDTTSYPSTTYPNWNTAPWAWAIEVDGVFWGMWQWLAGTHSNNHDYAYGNTGPTEDDYRAWVYRSIDGLAWYRAFEITSSATSFNLGVIPASTYMIYVPQVAG